MAMKPVTVTVKIGAKSETFADAKSENPLRNVEMAREWLKAEHVTLARQRDKERQKDHIAAQVKILRDLNRDSLADALEAGDIPRFQQLEALRVQAGGNAPQVRSVKPATVKAKAK